MWKLKQFMPKEPAGLEGRILEVGSIKLQVRHAIAQGGFSCVYLTRDAASSSKQYALKHVICQDAESLELAMKEISVMKMLKGHPNVVSLVAHTILDMGRTKEALLVMEFCEKSLVAVLENRGAGFLVEKQILLIFRDVCNAVFAMHCQSPPIAHRDLKAENILLGADGAWKLCDFGSTSTNHKCFNRPKEMGIEEDNIRKHTTPAYRAPEMWDLYRREVISEKVDIWALGCLLYRICYLKSAFDGESKLQILNGNYLIPELPKYTAFITNLIKDMLQSSPDARPDITQVWFRVNELLPVELQKNLPDISSISATDIRSTTSDAKDDGVQRSTFLSPQRSPPPPSLRENTRSISPPDKQHPKSSQNAPKIGGAGSPLGAFWSTQHARDSQMEDLYNEPVFDEEPNSRVKVKHNLGNHSREQRPSSPPRNSIKGPEVGSIEDFEIRFSPNGSEYTSDRTKELHSQSKASYQNKAFNTFMAEFDKDNLSSGNHVSSINSKSRSMEDELEAEVNRLKLELKQVTLDKEEMTSKYVKLSAICRSQRQEIQELKRALAAETSSTPSKDNSSSQISPGSSKSNTPPREKKEGTLPELQQGLFASPPPPSGPDPLPWSAFNEPKMQSLSKINSRSQSVRTVRATVSSRNSIKESTSSSASEPWGFDQDSFKAATSLASASDSEISKIPVGGNTSEHFGGVIETKVDTNQPAGWAGF